MPKITLYYNVWFIAGRNIHISPGITGVRLGALDADSAAADALAEVARLERLRDRLGEHGAAVDGRQPEGKLKKRGTFQLL